MTHIILLHEKGSSNPLGVPLDTDKVSFRKFFIIKDIVTVILTITLLGLARTIGPYIFIDPENFIKANPIVTPIHIQPE